MVNVLVDPDAPSTRRAAAPPVRRPPLSRVCVVGSGYIGSVIAAVLASRGCDVHAVDVDERLVAAFTAGECPITEPALGALVGAQTAAGRLRFCSDFAVARDCDVILLTVGTPLAPDYTADLRHVRAATAALAGQVRDGQLVMVKSTVPPGVTRDVVARGLREVADVHVAFSPERLAEGSAIRELLTLPIVVGGVDQASTVAAAAFWRSALDVEVIEVSSPEAAEMVKLADNLWIDLNVALAHDLARLCDALPYPLDVLEVIAGANSLKKGQHHVNILTPSNGVGGFCLTKDPWFVHALGTRHGIDLLTPQTSRTVNAAMPAYCAARIAGWMQANGRAVGSTKVAVLGLAFKTNSGDVRLTPVAPLLDALREHGLRRIVVHDPMVRAEEAERLGVTLEDSAEAAVAGADSVVFLVNHDPFRELTPTWIAGLATHGALVFDGRRYFDRAAVTELRALGLDYLGVGR